MISHASRSISMHEVLNSDGARRMVDGSIGLTAIVALRERAGQPVEGSNGELG
jgi:hypothetical protein